MKKLLAISLAILTVLGLQTSAVSARHVSKYHIGSYRINPKRTERTKAKRRRLDNAIYIMSLQLGANQTSLKNLHRDDQHLTTRQLNGLYVRVGQDFELFNGRSFNPEAFGINLKSVPKLSPSASY